MNTDDNKNKPHILNPSPSWSRMILRLVGKTPESIEDGHNAPARQAGENNGVSFPTSPHWSEMVQRLAGRQPESSEDVQNAPARPAAGDNGVSFPTSPQWTEMIQRLAGRQLDEPDSETPKR